MAELLKKGQAHRDKDSKAGDKEMVSESSDYEDGTETASEISEHQEIQTFHIQVQRFCLKEKGRFPFDQIFRFEIPGIPRDEWNSNFPVRSIYPPQAIGFQVSRENTRSNGGLFYLLFTYFGVAQRL